MNRTHLVAAGTTAAAAALVTAALVTPSTTANAADGADSAAPPTATAARAIAPFSCDGGAVTRTWDRGIANDYLRLDPGTHKNLPGSFTVRGPQKGKATLGVSVAGTTYLDTAGAGLEMQVLVDGQPIRPGNFAQPVIYSSGPAGYGTGAAQFCVQLGKGRHNVRVNVGPTSTTSGGYVGPMDVRAELSN